MKTTSVKLAASWGRRSVAATLLALFFCPAITLAETPLPDAPQPAPPADAAPQALQISILEGEGALNNIRERTAREPIVQVQDENHKPVAGALVLFTIHSGSGGAGASFNGLSTLSVTTDSAGRAVAHGFTPTGGSGNFTITVTATLGVLTAVATIHQGNGGGGSSSSNSSGSSSGGGGASSAAAHAGHAHSGLTWTIVAVAAAGAAGFLTYALTKNSGTQITPGTGTVHQ